MRRCFFRLFALGMMLATAPLGFADRASDIVAIHLEAIGGHKRVEAIVALRVTGQLATARDRASFTMTAARPDKVRMEMQYASGTLIQVTDGVHPPWEIDLGKSPPRHAPMDAETAKTFLSDAEFDDPLVAGPARGFQVEFAGEEEHEGRKMLRLLVTRKLSESFFLLLDAETYFIVVRIDEPLAAEGRRIQIVTRYQDFRPVQGVLVPHEVTVSIGGKLSQHARIDRIEANPRLTATTFTSP